VRGPLAIGCLQTLAPSVLPALRRSFAAAYPEVRASQRELDQAEIFSLLRRGEIDVALTYDLDLPPDLDFEAVASLSPYAILGASHPLADLTEVTVEELARHPMVLLDLPFSSEYFLSFFARAGLHPEVAERTRDMNVMRSLVANGFGFSIANVRPVSDLAPDGQPLRFVPLAEPVHSIRVGVLMAAGAGATHAIRAFVDHCRERQEAGEVPGLGDLLDACRVA
jgi:DNA-binding transcriptional LysR family regulator